MANRLGVQLMTISPFEQPVRGEAQYRAGSCRDYRAQVANAQDHRRLSTATTVWNFVLPGAIIVGFAAMVQRSGLSGCTVYIRWTWINIVYLLHG